MNDASIQLYIEAKSIESCTLKIDLNKTPSHLAQITSKTNAEAFA